MWKTFGVPYVVCEIVSSVENLDVLLCKIVCSAKLQQSRSSAESLKSGHFSENVLFVLKQTLYVVITIIMYGVLLRKILPLCLYI